MPLRTSHFFIRGDEGARRFCAEPLLVSPKQKPRVGDTGFQFFLGNPIYLILASLKSTCLRTTGSYFLNESFSVWVRVFFLVT